MVRAIDALTRSEASIAVITPYRAQKLLITKTLGKPIKDNWTVMTVDASQGTMSIGCVSYVFKVCGLCMCCLHVCAQVYDLYATLHTYILYISNACHHTMIDAGCLSHYATQVNRS